MVELRRSHPPWGPRTIRHQLAKEGVDPLPGRSSIYRCLVRHGLVDPQKRRRKREDYRRWERSRCMELWQMDVMGGVKLADGRGLQIVTGLDDHSRFYSLGLLLDIHSETEDLERLCGLPGSMVDEAEDSLARVGGFEPERVRPPGS